MKKWQYYTFFLLSSIAIITQITYATEQNEILSRNLKEHTDISADDFKGDFFELFANKKGKNFFYHIFINIDTDPLYLIRALGVKVEQGRKIAEMINEVEETYELSLDDKNSEKLDISKFFKFNTMEKMQEEGKDKFNHLSAYSVFKYKDSSKKRVINKKKDKEVFIITEKGSKLDREKLLELFNKKNKADEENRKKRHQFYSKFVQIEKKVTEQEDNDNINQQQDTNQSNNTQSQEPQIENQTEQDNTERDSSKTGDLDKTTSFRWKGISIVGLVLILASLVVVVVYKNIEKFQIKGKKEKVISPKDEE